MPTCDYCGDQVEVGMEFYVPSADPAGQPTDLTIACPNCAKDHPRAFRKPPKRS